MKLPWESPEPDEWDEPRSWRPGSTRWWEWIFEGAWLVPRSEMQTVIGPEYEMHLNGTPRG
jgi:hypothetical protein